MPASMTGYGRAESRGRGPRLLCEVRSVNHRFLATKIRLPNQLQRMEAWVEARVQSRFKRGSIEVSVFWRGASERLAARLDAKVADHYLKELRGYLKKHGIKKDVSPAVLFQLPGVLAPADPDEVLGEVKADLERVVDGALEQLAAMRGREGERLAKSLRRELATVSACAKRIKAKIPEIVVTFQSRLAERLKVLLQGASIVPDPAILAREVAVFAERSDVTEELDRLTSHEVEFEKLVARRGPIGRELEFLVQEMGREVQTVGAKAQDPEMLAVTREAKASLEKLREQVANIE